MSFTLDRLYTLLPAIYRLRDAEQEQPLKALLSVIVEQLEALNEDLDQLYDDLFVQTCAEWVVPYIGDLVGYQTLYSVVPSLGSLRAEVAHTTGYRRRKGTVAMLEQLAKDVTGWDARAVEFFQVLATTQSLNHLRWDSHSFASLRSVEALEQLNGPFDRLPHTVDVRRIANQRGRYNIANVGLFLWRLRAYPVTQGTATAVAPGCYTFNPLGLDAPLFNLPRTETEITQLAQPVNVPEPLRRRPLYHELEALRQALTDGQSPLEISQQSLYFGSEPVMRLFKRSGPALEEIPAAEILICDLRDPPIPLPTFWRRPPDQKAYQPTASSDPADQVNRPIQVAVDPVLGRIAFAAATPPPEQLLVSYAYGFNADLGGGQYQRQDRPTPTLSLSDDLDLATALATLGSESGVIEIPDSLTRTATLTLTLGDEQQLTIQAKNGARPVLDGTLTITAAANASLKLDGLLITGGIVVNGPAPLQLIVHHCTLPPWLTRVNGDPVQPATPAIRWDGADSQGVLQLAHCLSGRLITAAGLRIELVDSILDALQDSAIALAATEDGTIATGSLTLLRSTVIGQIHGREIELAENSLFVGQVISDRKQQGCVRFSYLPPSSQVPHQYNCQPGLAIRQALQAAPQQPLTAAEAAQITAAVLSRLRPQFTHLTYGHPAYAQLHRSCPVEIRTGAADGAEMGAFHDLYQPQRETNLWVRLEEYLRFGVEAGIFYTT